MVHPSGDLSGGLNSGPTPVRCEHLAPLEAEVNQGVLRQVLAQEFTIDLGLYIDVLKRHRLLVLSGFVVALALAMFSYVRVSADGLTYRSPEVWANDATLELSDPTYPELRSTLPPTADPNRFTSLVEQYVALATSDDVLKSLMKQRLISRNPEESTLGAISATSVASPINGAITPLLKITGMSSSPAQARRLTDPRDRHVDQGRHGSPGESENPGESAGEDPHLDARQRAEAHRPEKQDHLHHHPLGRSHRDGGGGVHARQRSAEA